MQIEVVHPEELRETLLKMAKGLGHHRVARLNVEGKTYFVKRPERRDSLKYWITKGHPLRAFKREVALLKAFGARDAPVATIVAEAPECIVTADHGPTVLSLLKQRAVGPEIFFCLGQSLWGLHELGLTHGRPVLRDLCWDERHLTFLDLEAGAKLNATPHDFARDVLILLHSILVSKNTTTDDGLAFLRSYFAHQVNR